jgi:hypothetical protein
MVDDNTQVAVRNLVNHKVVYLIPETHRKVVFEAFQERKVPAGELRMINYTTGGSNLIHNFLCVKNDELREEFNIDPEMVEYDWTLDDIKKALTTEDLDVLLDALEYGPEGIRQMLIDYAIEWRIPDTNRRKAITDITGVQVNRIIELMEQAEVYRGEEVATEPVGGRRRSQKKEAARSGRRVQH